MPSLVTLILAVHRPDSPLFFFDGYLGIEGQGWTGDYYLTGDTVEQNEDGSVSFVGRSDDVITSAGYRIGPFDVESCLLEHEVVAENPERKDPALPSAQGITCSLRRYAAVTPQLIAPPPVDGYCGAQPIQAVVRDP